MADVARAGDGVVSSTLTRYDVAVIDATLSTKARRHLKALAHGLRPVVRVGSEGITESLCRATSIALEDHELIKVRLGPGYEGDRKQAARALAEATDAHVAQVIGRVIVLYRRRQRDDSDRPRIELPG